MRVARPGLTSLNATVMKPVTAEAATVAADPSQIYDL